MPTFLPKHPSIDVDQVDEYMLTHLLFEVIRSDVYSFPQFDEDPIVESNGGRKAAVLRDDRIVIERSWNASDIVLAQVGDFWVQSANKVHWVTNDGRVEGGDFSQAPKALTNPIYVEEETRF